MSDSFGLGAATERALLSTRFLPALSAISITGWDGSLAPFSPFYIYTAYGILLDGETEVEKSGTFIVIN